MQLCDANAGLALAEVGLVEPMGGIQGVWLTAAGGASLAVEVNADAAAPDMAPGRVGFNVDARRVSLFDPQTQARL